MPDISSQVDLLKSLIYIRESNDCKINENVPMVDNIVTQALMNRKKREIIMRVFDDHLGSMLSMLSNSANHVTRDANLGRNHRSALKAFENMMNFDCDLSTYVSPPKSAFVLVKCTKNCGTILVPSGLVSITAGSVLHVPPEDIKALADLNAVEIIQ